jgi:hypothetical protein
LSACSTPPDLDLSLSKPSAAGMYRVSLEPPVPAPGVNQMHSWRVRVATPTGEPVHGARITVGGGMPQHGHGFPTRPRVTREIDNGVYLLEGMKFSMTGWWDIKLDIDAAPGPDKVVFNTIVQAARPE